MSARVRWRVAEQEEEQDAVGAEEGVHGVAVQPPSTTPGRRGI